MVESTAASIDHHVITTLLNKYNIVAHCHAIKQYLLLSRVRSTETLGQGHIQLPQHLLRPGLSHEVLLWVKRHPQLATV